MNDTLRKYQKVDSDCLTFSAGRHHIAMLAVLRKRTKVKSRRAAVDLKTCSNVILSLVQLLSKLGGTRKGRQRMIKFRSIKKPRAVIKGTQGSYT